MSYEQDQPLLALDYSRIAATVLWAQCKHQQAQLEALTLRRQMPSAGVADMELVESAVHTAVLVWEHGSDARVRIKHPEQNLPGQKEQLPMPI